MTPVFMRRAVAVPALILVTTLASAAHKHAHAQTAPNNTIVMKNFDFSPMTLTVPAGTTVTWRNMDGEPHTVTSTAGLFRSGALDTNDHFSFTFAKAGTYKYLCSIHPKMQAAIIVK